MMANVNLLPRANTLKQKLLLWLLLPMILLLIITCALTYQFGQDDANRQHDKYLAETSQILLDQLRTQNGRVEFSIHTGARILLTQDKNDQVYYSLRGWNQNFQFGEANLPLPPAILSDKPLFYMTTYAGKPLRMMAVLTPETDVASGKVIILIGKTLVLNTQRTYEWIWRVLPAQIILIIAATLMMWLAIGRGLLPLAKLQKEIANRSVRDLSPLPKESVVAEFQPLIISFNELLDRLNRSFISKRQFVADAAHQLRTPLAGLKMQAELALRLDDSQEIRHSLAQICKAADHATHLANQLLALARVETDSHKTEQMKKLDLLAVAKNSIEFWIATAFNKRLDLGFEGDSLDCQIIGNALLLNEMLNNFIDNALRYTPAEGKVTVRVFRDNDAVCLEIEDTGPGIPEDQRELVFERFYRILGSNQEGCGLGLAIAREIIYFHDAKIFILSGAEGKGTLIKAIFPDTIIQNEKIVISQSGKYPIYKPVR